MPLHISKLGNSDMRKLDDIRMIKRLFRAVDRTAANNSKAEHLTRALAGQFQGAAFKIFPTLTHPVHEKNEISYTYWNSFGSIGQNIYDDNGTEFKFVRR